MCDEIQGQGFEKEKEPLWVNTKPNPNEDNPMLDLLKIGIFKPTPLEGWVGLPKFFILLTFLTLISTTKIKNETKIIYVEINGTFGKMN